VPELPEVETIRRGLAPRVEGRVLERFEVADARWCEPLAAAELEDAVRGRRVERLGRRGKYLVAHLEDDVHLIMHLRMTGTVLYDADPALGHVRVRIGLDDGHTLVWVDPRRFGTGQLALGGDALDAFMAERLGAEPLTDAFTPAYLRAAAKGRRAPIKAFLLDQRRIAGVGNIYADEALFRAHIHPLRETGRLKGPQLDALHGAVNDALAAGIEAKGASIDDYRDPDGVQGSFQDRFLVHLRAGEPCPRCGNVVVKMVAAGRGTYVCEKCQPRPRVARRP
jgi:formamidopyrimidine-DNA glycosylase